MLVEVDHEGILMNVNTMEDYEKAKKAVLKRSPESRR
jgi:GTP:adenosylcobinamide-phosphate guanylyltransferase